MIYDNGNFIPETRDDIQTYLTNLFTENFGDRFITNRDNPEYPLSVLKNVLLDIMIKNENIELSLFNNIFRKTSEGKYLDNNSFPLTRLEATKSSATLTFSVSGTINETFLIPMNSIIETGQGVQFTNSQEHRTTLTSDQMEIDVLFTAVIAGSGGNVEADTITIINSLTPILDVDSVTNEINSTGGTDDETDTEFRIRGNNIISGSSSAIAIRRRLLQDNRISSVIIDDNVENTKNLRGVPGHSFHIIIKTTVEAGSEEEYDIIRIIAEEKPAGVRAWSPEFTGRNRTFTDSGVDYIIGYSTPMDIPVSVVLNLTVNQQYDDSFNDVIKENIIKYIGGQVNNEVYSGLDIGRGLKAFEIIGVLNEIGMSELTRNITEVTATVNIDNSDNPPRTSTGEIITITFSDDLIVTANDITINVARV